MSERLYCDGGVIGRTPSKFGGTWAWIRVKGNEVIGDTVIASASGIIRPEDIDRETCENNYSELRAVIEGCEALPMGWEGTICSDNLSALKWLFGEYTWKNLPESLRIRLMTLNKSGRIIFIEILLLGGHPTGADLATGFRKRDGKPVSKWNVWCDKECTRLANQVKAAAERQKELTYAAD